MRLRSGKATLNGSFNDSFTEDRYNSAHFVDQDGDSIMDASDSDVTDNSIRTENISFKGSRQRDVPVAPAPKLSCLRRCCDVFIKCVVFLFVFLVVIAPAVIKVFPDIPKHMVYLNSIKIPVHVNLSDPTTVGLHYTRSFFFHAQDDIDLGIWHVLPKSLEKKDSLTEDYFVKSLSKGLPIILYCHGNTGTRGTDHRVQMYEMFAGLNFHVVAVDYRGFGDSSGSPTTEIGVVSDVAKLYMWLREKAGKDVPIYFWGHSLGSGIATKTVRELKENYNTKPKGLILESAFNNIYDAAMHHPFAVVFRLLWWFDDLFLKGMHDSGIYLQSDENILHIDVPVLIMHAEDDFVVPYELGEKLYEASRKRPSTLPPVTFHSFARERGFAHKWICKATELPDIVSKFVKECQKTKDIEE